MIKFILALTVLVVSYNVNAEYLNKSSSRDGNNLISIVNDNSHYITCQIYNNTYYIDFMVAPNTSSRWYIEPNSKYEWECY